MAENEFVKDDLAIEQAFEQMIENEINIAIKNNKTEATIKLNDGGKAVITIKIEKATKPEAYRIYMQGHHLASIDMNGEYNYRMKLKDIEKATPEISITKAIAAYNARTRQEKLGDGSDSAKLQKELEKAKKEDRAEPIRTGREITSGESLSELTNRMFGEKMHEVYRIRGKDAHSFKYVGLNNAGKYVEFGGSTKHEGTNPDQKVFILTTAGKLEEKTVDHLMTNGKYAIATDIPDSAIADRTRTLVGNRLPSGRYLFIEALDSRNASASNNKFVKHFLTRGESQYRMEDVADAIELAQKIRGLNSDGSVTAEELELVVKLKEKGYDGDEINDVINFIHDLSSKELDNTKIRAILDSTETTANQIEEMEKAHITEEQQLEVFSKMYDSKRGCISFEQAFSEVKNGSNYGDDDTQRKKKEEQYEREGKKRQDDEDENEFIYGQPRRRERPH